MSAPTPQAASRPFTEHASWPRRVLALVLDWILSTLVVVGVVGLRRYSEDPAAGWFVLATYWLEASVLTTLAGGSFGQLVSGIRVLTLQHQPLPLLPSFARHLLVCVVIPPLIFRSADGRGLHDMWTGSATYVRA